MSRFSQGLGKRGSLTWIQRAVNDRRDTFDPLVLAKVPSATSIDWRSPLAIDECAEYRDAAFLERVGAGHLKEALAEFWPARGPQWDALGRTDTGDILLVEAKAHIAEMCSPACGAGEQSRARIASRLATTAESLGATPRAAWTEAFYQLANRIAHLHFLTSHGERAWLVLVSFVGDTEMGGPTSPGEWNAAYQIAWHVMGIGTGRGITDRIVHVHPEVARLA